MSANTSADAGPNPVDPIIIQIGEKRFYTTKATISQSAVLSALVSVRPPDPERPYFVDADPALFEHILRYLRTGIFPLLHDVDKGHDVLLYHALEQQAEFYQIERLANWLHTKAYLDAVSTKTVPMSFILYGEPQFKNLEEMIKPAGRAYRVLRVDESRSKAYLCPNRNWRHDGQRTICINTRCLPSSAARHSFLSEMPVYKVELVIHEVKINQELVKPASEQPALPPPYQHT